jgi:thioredoxin-like negative regulator of GroEL
MAEPITRARLLRAWRVTEPVLWVGLLVMVVTVQWPVLKGWHFRLTGAPAPQAAVSWRTDFTAALTEARNSEKLVLLSFTASWCPSCVAMAHDVWPDAEVARAVEGACVPVTVDVDRDQHLSARFQVDAIPAVVLVDSDGRLVARHDGFLPRSGVLRFLREQTSR